MKNFTLISFLALTSLTSFAAQAEESPVKGLLECTKGQAALLVFQYRAGGFETYGQVTFAPFHTVNVVCNNAVGLMGADKSFRCAGIDRDQTPIVLDVIRTNDGYSWNGTKCEQ